MAEPETNVSPLLANVEKDWPEQVHYLSQIFNDTATSYKFVWFLAILSLVKREPSIRVLRYSDLFKEMVVIAWCPVCLHRLSLGAQDKLQTIVQEIKKKSQLPPNAEPEEIRKFLSGSDTGLVELLRYVPFRLLTPWCTDQVLEKRDSEKDRIIRDFANNSQETGLPTLYSFLPSDDGIEINPLWHTFLTKNLETISEFATSHFSRYLQAKNSSVPDVVNKLRSTLAFPPIENVRATKEMITQEFHTACEGVLKVEIDLVRRFVASLLSKRFLILSGLSGSGKTKLAQAFAKWITPKITASDPFVPGATIQGDRINYIVHRSDTLSVEFWNHHDEAQATKVTLPRAIIKEWANYISAHGLTRATPARAIREAVTEQSQFSAQLHSFETHLKAAAFALLEAPQTPVTCYKVIPVGADWTGNENILGYPNGLDDSSYVTKPTLDLIRQACAYRHIPHFLILDEMNLSHVERYFADLLSAIESGEAISLYQGSVRNAANEQPVDQEIELPENLFIIGTVNVDETTYMFSPKVLDRANVIEFRIERTEMDSFLGSPAVPNLDQIAGKGERLGQQMIDYAREQVTVPDVVNEEFRQEMLLFFDVLKSHGAEFGYRVVNETARFLHYYKTLGDFGDDNTEWFDKAFDAVIVQKFLPKLHGSKTKLGPLLKKLWFLSTKSKENRGDNVIEALEDAVRSTETNREPSNQIPDTAPYPQSAEKINRMWRSLAENGFASFAEA